MGRGNKIRGSILERAFPHQKGNSIYLTKEKFFGRLRGNRQDSSEFQGKFVAHAPRVGRIKGRINFNYGAPGREAGKIRAHIPASKYLYLEKGRKILLRSKF